MNAQIKLTRIVPVAFLGLFLLPIHSSAVVTRYDLSISGDQAVPGPGDPDGQASGFLAIDDVSGEICWRIPFSNIASPTAMHVHSGAAGEGGGVVVPLNVEMTGGGGSASTSASDGVAVASESMSEASAVAAAAAAVATSDGEGILAGCTTGDAASVMAILAAPSNYYVNIHNADFPPGAVRGQLGN